MTFAFLTIVYVLQAFSVYQRGAFLEAKKRKNLKNNGKKCLLKLAPKHYAILKTAFLLSYKVQFSKFPSYYFAF